MFHGIYCKLIYFACVVAEITFKVVVNISSVAKIIFVVAEITLKVAVITSSVDKSRSVCLWL